MEEVQTQTLAPNQPPKLISVSELFSRSFGIYKTLFWKLIGMSLLSVLGYLPVMLIIAIYFAVSHFTMSSSMLAVVYVLLGLLGLAAILFALYILFITQVGVYIIVRDNNPTIKIKETFKAARLLAISFFETNFVTCIFLVLWTLLLIIPGIIMSVFYQFVPWVFVVEGLRNRAAMKRSKELVKGNWWAVFGRLILPVVILILISATIGMFIGGDKTTEDSGYSFVNQIISLVIEPFFLAYSYYLYKSLVNLKNNQAVK